MRNLLLTVVVIAIVVCVLGFWRGWFEFGSNKQGEKVQANLNIDLNKFKQDKDAFKKTLSDKSRTLKDKLASLKDKAKGLSGDAKVKAEKEIDTLSKKHESIESKMKEVDESTVEKFGAIKDSLAKELDLESPEGKAPEADKPK
jgi:preprotein translocase subunit SecF